MALTRSCRYLTRFNGDRIWRKNLTIFSPYVLGFLGEKGYLQLAQYELWSDLQLNFRFPERTYLNVMSGWKQKIDKERLYLAIKNCYSENMSIFLSPIHWFLFFREIVPFYSIFTDYR